MTTKPTICLITGLSLCGTAMAQQDQFTDTIESGPLTVGIIDFAVLPDSSNPASSSSGPARMNVMTSDPLGRLFVNDQRGGLYLLDPASGAATEYLNLLDFSGISLDNGSGERGFQSFAFHPDFANQGTAGFGKFYTAHTSSDTSPTPDFDPGGNDEAHSVLLEWSVTNPSASTYSTGGGAPTPRELIRFNQPFTNHNLGQLAFNTSAGPGNPDRNHLYIGVGDAGSGDDPQENGQDASNPYGAILRIDPLGNNSDNGQYGIVADNTFASDADANTLAEIFAYGLRNTQRFGWDDLTGDFYGADIGQSDFEEINRIVNGGNYGWDEREGSFFNEGPKTAGMTDPVVEYDHTNLVADMPTPIGNRAITMSEVIRGSGIPGLDGQLLLGDFPTGLIFYADVDDLSEGAGQDPLAELILLDTNDQEVRLIELINQTREDNDLDPVSRTDLRFSYGIDGRVFVLNKHDGVVRELVVPEPGVAAIIGVLGLALAGRRNARRGRSFGPSESST